VAVYGPRIDSNRLFLVFLIDCRHSFNTASTTRMNIYRDFMRFLNLVSFGRTQPHRFTRLNGNRDFVHMHHNVIEYVLAGLLSPSQFC